jgi:hypothetical protein
MTFEVDTRDIVYLKTDYEGSDSESRLFPEKLGILHQSASV